MLKPVQSLVKAKGASEWYLFDKKGKRIAGPTPTKEGLFTPDHPKAVNGEQVFGVPKGTVIITCGSSNPKSAPAVCPGQNASPLAQNFYLFKYHPSTSNKIEGIPELTGKDLNPDGVRQDVNPTTNQSVVRLAFHSHGDSEFQTVTRRLYQRGQLRQTPQHFAIVLDRDIKSFPQIDYTDSSLSDGISGGGEIEGVTPSEAHDLALVLKYGALPIPFAQVERSDVSATLGADSLQQAKTAALFGLLIVAIFLLIFYRFLGVVAVLGLAIYSAFLYAAILILNVTITLPGFAGLILTIGVAADANVVIFERIKEEVAAGKSVRAAVATGYQKGFHTILDANVVTAITALVLFAVATAQVKGFALMLLLGTVISLVTAVVATRAMLGLLAGFRWFDNPHFMGARGQQIPKWQRIDVNGPRRRRVFLSIATFAIALSIVFLVVKGLNLGIDFKGGTQISFNTPQAVTLSKIRDQTSAIGRGDAVVQGRGSAFGTDTYKSFQLRTKSLTPTQQDKLTKNLEDQLHVTKLGVKSVSSSFSRQIARDAILAIIVSFALILLYVTLRYQWRFAVPILRTLFSDILITVGVYALSGTGGDDGDRGRRAHRSRVLDLRHDHRLRPNPGEHAADAALHVRGDRQPVGVGGASAVDGDFVHHAAADRLSADLRRSDAQGLRIRALHRHRGRRRLDDLRRHAVPDGAHGAQPRVQAARPEGRAGARAGGRGGSPEPEPEPVPAAVAVEADGAGRDCGGAGTGCRRHRACSRGRRVLAFAVEA